MVVRFVWSAAMVAALVTGGIAQGAEAPAVSDHDGQWHGSFACLPIGALGRYTPRSASFGFVVSGGKAEVASRFQEAGGFKLQVSFETAPTAALSLQANSGEAMWGPLETMAQASLLGDGLVWDTVWETAQCKLILAIGPLLPDAGTTIDSPNDPAGRGEINSSAPRHTLVAAPNDPEVRAPAVSTSSEAKVSAPSTVEIAYWESVRDSHDPAELQAYLARYPAGAFADLARLRLARLEAK